MTVGTRKRPLLAQEFVARHKRRRFVDALAGLCVEQGYRAVTVSGLCVRARLARATFYELFLNMDEVFFVGVEAGFEEAIGLTEDACRAPSGSVEQRLEAGLAALLDLLAGRPEIAWMCLVEAPAVMPRGLALYEDALSRCEHALRDAVPPGQDRPTRPAAEFAVGGIASILRTRLQHGEAERLAALLPELLGFAVDALRPGAGPPARQGRMSSRSA
jgi:AcrR family transcriptional regulator